MEECEKENTQQDFNSWYPEFLLEALFRICWIWAHLSGENAALGYGLEGDKENSRLYQRRRE